MATQGFSVLPGATSPVFPVGPMHNVIAGPSALGGTVLVEFAPSVNGPWRAWDYPAAYGNVGSFRPPTAGYCRVTAATLAANYSVADMGQSNTPNVDQMINVTNTMATANTTSEVVVASFRTPPNFLTPGMALIVNGGFSLNNSANGKQFRFRVGGVNGTLMLTFPLAGSFFNFTYQVGALVRPDGTLIGMGSQNSTGGGLGGGGSAAYPTAAVDVITKETEWVITVAKVVGSEAVATEWMLVSAY